MIAKFLKVALVSSVLLCQGHNALAQSGSRTANLPAPPSQALYKSVLYVSQSTDLNQSVSSSPSARFGPLTVSKNGYGVRANFTDVSRSSGIQGLPRINYGSSTTTENALATAKAWAGIYSKNYVAGIQSYLLSRGISIAYFSYYQAVNISTAGTVRKKGIMWSGTVDINGRALYGDPRIVDGDPIFIDAQYFPLQTGEGVLASEGYENAGKILWRLLDKGLKPLPTAGSGANGYVTIDTGGAYDETSDSEGDVGAVSCFVDKRHPNCTRSIGGSIADAATIATQQGASGVFAYYAQAAQMDYVQSGSDQIPVMAISYDKRELTCTALSEVVSVGKQITLNGSLYFGAFNGTYFDYALMDHLSRKQVIQPTAYSRSATVDYLATIKYDPLKTLLSPFTDATLPQLYTLDYASQADTADFLSKVTYISSLNDKRQAAKYVGLLDDAVKSEPSSYIMKIATTGLPATSGGGGSSGGTTVSLQSTTVSPKLIAVDSGDGSGGGGGSSTTTSDVVVEYELGIGNTSSPAPDNNVNGGAGTDWARSFSFNVADATKVPTFLLTYLGWDDHLQVLINGTQVVHTDGGNMIAQANTAAGAQCSGNWATVPVMECAAYQYGGEGDYYCYDWRQVGTRQEWRANPYAAYMTQISTNAWVRVEPYESCGESSCYTQLELMDYAGCVWSETKSSRRVATNIDLKPYLVNGMNTITIHLAAGDGGEGWVRMKASAVPMGCQ